MTDILATKTFEQTVCMTETATWHAAYPLLCFVCVFSRSDHRADSRGEPIQCYWAPPWPPGFLFWPHCSRDGGATLPTRHFDATGLFAQAHSKSVFGGAKSCAKRLFVATRSMKYLRFFCGATSQWAPSPRHSHRRAQPAGPVAGGLLGHQPASDCLWRLQAVVPLTGSPRPASGPPCGSLAVRSLWRHWLDHLRPGIAIFARDALCVTPVFTGPHNHLPNRRPARHTRVWEPRWGHVSAPRLCGRLSPRCTHVRHSSPVLWRVSAAATPTSVRPAASRNPAASSSDGLRDGVRHSAHGTALPSPSASASACASAHRPTGPSYSVRRGTGIRDYRSAAATAARWWQRTACSRRWLGWFGWWAACARESTSPAAANNAAASPAPTS